MPPKVRNYHNQEVDGLFLTATGWLLDQAGFPRWIRSKITWEDLRDTGETDADCDVTIATLPAGVMVHAVQANLITGFDAVVTLTQMTMTVGDTANPDGLLAAISNLDDDGGTVGWQAIANSALGAYLYDGTAGDRLNLLWKFYTAATAIFARFTATGDTINDLKQGEIDVALLVSSPGYGAVLPAGTT